MVVVWVVEFDLFFYAGRKSLFFSVRMQIDLNVVGGPNWFDFSVGDQT